MSRTAMTTAVCWVALACGLAPAQDTVPVTEAEQRAWLNHVLPLPHEISIPRKCVLTPSKISIRTRDTADATERNAARELNKFFRQETGAVPAGKQFTITLGVLDGRGRIDGITVSDVDRLRKVPNNDQAYVIHSPSDNALVLAALHPKGVYYASVTLRQLLEPVTTKEKTEIPLLSILDWPDIEERGLWNCGTLVLDLAPSTKFNFMKGNVYLSPVKRGEPNHASIRKERREKALLMGVNHVPSITHLNFLHRTGLYQAYPELLGKGDGAIAGRYRAHVQKGRTVEHRVPCASNPVLSQILSEWMMDVAAAGVTECAGWLSERPAQCECKKCTVVGQFVLEARAFVNAWRKVREKHPKLVLRVFISTTTNEKYEQVLAELPAGVKLERACAAALERQTQEPRDRFLNPRIDPYAAKGRWVATYDVPVTATGKVETPEVVVPASFAHRIKDFVQQMAARKYRGLYGMLEGGILRSFNVEALAEWTWNLNGRTEREFAVAWADRHGYEDPQAVGAWSELIGPVAWDVYDSGYPECYTWGLAAKMIAERQRPVLGKGLFRYYRDKDSFDKKLAVCDRALAIAKELIRRELVFETQVVMSYVKMAKSIYLIAQTVSSADLTDRPTKRRLGKSVEDLCRAADENVSAIHLWRSAAGPKPWHRRVTRAMEATKSAAQEISRTVASLQR